MAITKEQLVEIVKEVFTAIDKDNSGFLEKAECHTLAVNLHQKWAHHKEADGSEAKPFNEEMFEKGFALMDKSGDGKISFAELEGFFVNVATKRGIIAWELF